MDSMNSHDHEPVFSVFLAEDDFELRTLLADVLRRDGHAVFEASNGETMLFHLVQFGVERPRARREDSIVICDIRMPGCDGLTVLRNLREHDMHCPPFVFTTAFADGGTLREAEELGALRVFEKPFELAELRTLVRHRAAESRAACAG
jgi:CheY-like chemotaxis protein